MLDGLWLRGSTLDPNLGLGNRKKQLLASGMECYESGRTADHIWYSQFALIVSVKSNACENDQKCRPSKPANAQTV